MEEIKQTIREILSDARISKAYKGYPYLEHAIYLVIEDEYRLCHIYNEVYGKVGEYYGTTASAVEKNLRTVRNVFWKSNCYDFFRERSGVILYYRPYLRELIELFANEVWSELGLRDSGVDRGGIR